MPSGLPVSDIIRVDVNSQPVAVLGRNFGSMLIAGDSPVIDTGELIREYPGLDSIAQDFGADAPEYQAAKLWFSQVPRPTRVFIGRVTTVPTAGLLRGATIPPTLQDMALYTPIKDGSMVIPVDGAPRRLTGIDLSSALNINGVAALIDAALPGASVRWDSVSSRIVVQSDTTGTASGVGYASSAGAGTDLSDLLGLTAAAGARNPVPGGDAKGLLASVHDLADHSFGWYGLTLALDTPPTVQELLRVAEFVEASDAARMLAATITTSDATDPNESQDFGSLAKLRKLDRTTIQFSSTNPFAAVSMFGRQFTVDFTGNNTASTAMFKQQPGVIPEQLRVSEVRTLERKGYNIYTSYQNGVAILQPGKVASGRFFDEIHGLDWLKDTIETLLFNLHYQSTTKIPQTDEGVTQLLTETERGLELARFNGFIAPGVWNADPFGYLKRGQALPKGYYTFARPIGEQLQSEREARRAPVIQVALKLSGAFHSAHVILNVNR